MFIAALVIGLFATTALFWQWGLGGLGIGMFLLLAVMLFFKRFSQASGDKTSNPAGLSNDGILPLVLTLSDQASASISLPQALQLLGNTLQPWLQAREFHCLRVESWNGDTALVRPWTSSHLGEDHIDPATMSIVKHDDAGLGQALVLKRPCFAHLNATDSATLFWRDRAPIRIIAVPVMVDNWPVALIEFIDPQEPSEQQNAVLNMASSQLSFVAQRDNTQTRIANDAEHLGRLGLVASRISSGVAVLDRHGVIEWINPMFVALTGWPHQRVLGRALPDLLTTELQDAQQGQEVARLLTEGGPFRIAFESNREAATSITRYWAELDAILMLDEAGGRSQYVCLLNDITQRKQQEYQQAQEKEFLEALLGNLPISLIVSDPTDFSIAAINRYAEFELGLKHEQVVKRRLIDVMGEQALSQAEPFMRQAIQSGEAAEHDFIWWKDGRKITLHARHFALRHANGDPRLLITLAHDISYQQQAKVDMEESERRFREIVESMDDCVYVATERHENFTYVSPGLPDMLGVSADALIKEKRLFESLVVAEDRHMVDDRLLHVLAQAQHPTDVTSHDVVVSIQHATKGTRWIRRRSRVRQLADGQVRVYGLLSDVTDERTQAMELSRAKDDAENASRAKSQFMASMSHEIRTPMNAILGLTELLLGTPLNDQQRRHAQVVYRSGESLLEIINDILDFSKIEAGHLELAPTEFSIQSLLDDALELMAHKAHEKGIEITAHFESEMPATVIADPMRLQQILTNLISNAIKFTDHGEVVVTVNCKPIEASTTTPTSLPVVPLTPLNIEFHIRDTGIGISQQVLPKLFSAFTQANAGLARRYGGTGLGLAITKQLVELMGGHISVQSALGVGSEFTFNIPVTMADDSAEKGHTDDLTMPHLGILVVDDNATNRTVLENILSAWGMDVMCVADGQEALDYLLASPNEDRRIDMALVDMNMPRVDGFEFAKQLKASGRYANMRMILLSSTSASDDVRRSQELGFSRFVAKPLRKPELRQAILGISADLLPPTAALPNLKLNVLVIEDNAVNREVCAQMLVRLGCRAHLASSAMEGLKKLCETRYDIILLDIAMPGMDGEETIQQFRSNRVTRFKFETPTDTPVVAVTAHVEEQRFLELGFDAFLSKPYRLHQLARVLQACMKAAGKPVPLINQAPTASTKSASDMPRSARAAPATSATSATAHPWQEVFDESAVMRLLELDPTGKNQLLERVTKMFEVSVDKYLLQLEDAWRSEDFKSIKDIVHTLKSSSANVGAIKLSQCCIEVEYAMRNPGAQDLTSLISSLKQAARTVQSALPRLLEAHR